MHMAIAETFEHEPAPFQGGIEDAHKAYHSLEHRPDIDPQTVAAIGGVLCRSTEIDHIIDSGWAFMQAGSELRDPGIVASGVDILIGITRHYERTPAWITAGIPLAISAEYGKLAHGIEVNPKALSDRLFSLNNRIFRLRSEDLRQSTGIAPEVASLYLLNRFFADNQNRFKGVLAWPAFPWQDNRLHANQKGNFDIIIGTSPHEGIKIQVKNLLEPTRGRGRMREDGDILLERWRRKYDKDISLIFGDVHLGNTPSEPFAINRSIKRSNRPDDALQVRLATINILDELGIEHDLSTASCASKPKLQIVG